MKFLRTHALAILFAAHVTLKLAVLPRVISTPLMFDETYYDNAARTLANAAHELVTGGGLPAHELQDRLLSNGWFMPGMSGVLAPLYLVAPSAGIAATRVYIGVLTLLLFGIVVYVVRRTLGRRYAAALLIVPGLIPVWVLYSYTVLGDEAAGLMVVLVVALLVKLWHRLYSRRTPPRLLEGLVLGAALATTLYLRSSALPLAVGLLVLVTLACLLLLRGRMLVRGLAAVTVAGLVFGALLAPWSAAATRTFGARVVTTTTLPLSEAFAFGHRDQLCFGPCPGGGGIWLEMARYSRLVGDATGESEITVQREMARYALRDVTLKSYANDVLHDMSRYALRPADAYVVTATGSVEGSTRLIVWLTDGLYFGGLLLAALALLVVRRREHHEEVVAILAGLSAAALFIQPFIHVCTPRYWPVFVPLLGLAAATLFSHERVPSGSSPLRLVRAAVGAAWLGVLGLLVVCAAL